jgi:hypothetical protein
MKIVTLNGSPKGNELSVTMQYIYIHLLFELLFTTKFILYIFKTLFDKNEKSARNNKKNWKKFK